MTRDEQINLTTAALVPLIRAEFERQAAADLMRTANYAHGVVGDPSDQEFTLDGHFEMHKVAEVVARWHADAIEWIVNPGMNGR